MTKTVHASGVLHIGPPPRVVRTKWRMSWLAVAYVLLMGLPGWMVGDGAVALHVLSHGEPIEATIESTHTSHHRSDTIYWVRYHYSLDGRVHNDEQDVDFQTFENARFGQHVAGRAMVLWGYYVCVTELTDAHRDAIKAIGAGALLLFVMMALPWAIWNRNRRLVESGEAVAGTITRKWQSSGRYSTNNRMTYEFTTRDGRNMTGKALVSRRVYNAMHTGHGITVIYDPARPRRKLVYEFSNFQVKKA